MSNTCNALSTKQHADPLLHSSPTPQWIKDRQGKTPPKRIKKAPLPSVKETPERDGYVDTSFSHHRLGGGGWIEDILTEEQWRNV